MKFLLRWWLGIFAITCVFQQGFSLMQLPLAAIKGKITDPSDAVIPNATVVLRDKQSGTSRIGITEQDGSYELERLEPSEYELEVSLPGFANAFSAMTLRAGEYITVNVQLEVGKVNENVAVSSAVSGIDT